MTKPELFGLPKWLTEKEEELLAASYRGMFDALIQASDFTVANKSVVNADVIATQVQAASNSLYFGLAKAHYVYRQTFDKYFNITPGVDPKPPYILYSGPAPFDIADVLTELSATYGLALGFGDVNYNFGDLIPAPITGQLKLTLRNTSFRYKGTEFPIYAAPEDRQPLLRMINPDRFLPGFRDLFQDVDQASAGEVQYFAVNATRAYSYIQTLNGGFVFTETADTWDFGNNFLIPRFPGDTSDWVSSETPRFQNIYNARVVYNGKLRVVDPVPVNDKLTHTLVLRLDPKYSLRATGLIRVFYRLPDPPVPLSSILTVTALEGFVYVP